MFLPFGEWTPDLPTIDSGGALTATNVIPDAKSYRSFPSLVTYSNTSLGSRCKGGVFAIDAASVAYNYAGDASALYRLGNQTFSDATRLAGGAYTVNADDYWEFVNWGNTVIGVNGFADAPQQISLGAANFAALAGTPPKARHITTLRDFVVMGNVSDSAANVFRVRWSAINNAASWTVDAATLADFQDLPSEGGWVQKVLGGEYGVILQERSVWRMTFVGSPLIFQFDKIMDNLGAYIAQAAVRFQNLVFFLATDGFYSFDGNQINPIGRGKIDKFFFTDLDTNNLSRVHAAVDPANKIVMWAYPSVTSSNGGNPDKLIIYNWAFQRWSIIEGLNIELLINSITTGYTLDGLDAVTTNLDSLAWPLDSKQWTGGQVILAAYNSAHRLSRFNGSSMAATVDTGEQRLSGDMKTFISRVRPYVIGNSVSAQVAIISRNVLTSSASITSATSPNSTGFVPTRNSSFYQRIRVTTIGSSFDHLYGVDIEAQPEGYR